MNKKLLISLLAVLLVVISLCGCFQSDEQSIKLNSEEKRFLGTWANTSQHQGNTITLTYVFLPDKTYEVTAETEIDSVSYNGTWKTKDNQLVIAIEGRTQTGNYQFLNNDQTLIISDTNNGNNTVLIKQ